MDYNYQAPPKVLPPSPEPAMLQPRFKYLEASRRAVQPTKPRQIKSPKSIAARPIATRPSTYSWIGFRPERDHLEFSQPSRVAPTSGIQLYSQRLNALRSGRLYTRLTSDSYYEKWSQAQGHASYEQWRQLLALEARSVSRSRGVSVMVGDSLSQWFPVDRLPNGQQVWLNQGISGDTTKGVLNRINAFAGKSPQTIYFMAGVNDVKRGVSDRDILRNIQQIVRRLKQQNPGAQIVVQSILPTRSEMIDNDRITRLNPQIAQIAQKSGVVYLDLHSQFRDSDGALRSDLTTDGIHLSARGYATWQASLQRSEQWIAQQRTRAIAVR
jgi:lysophospholipase L1-like esterase